MRQLARVTVTMQELDRLKCIQAVVTRELKPLRAAERLGLTSRQVRRLAMRYRAEGGSDVQASSQGLSNSSASN